MLSIDMYLAARASAEARHRNRSLLSKLAGVSYNFGGMITGQIKSSPTKPGLMGHAPLGFPQVFSLAFIGFVIIMFIITKT